MSDLSQTYQYFIPPTDGLYRRLGELRDEDNLLFADLTNGWNVGALATCTSGCDIANETDMFLDHAIVMGAITLKLQTTEISVGNKKYMPSMTIVKNAAIISVGELWRIVISEDSPSASLLGAYVEFVRWMKSAS